MATAHRLSRARWAMPVGGVLAGVLIALAVPRHAASTTRF
jgi:hypothetical protein